MRLEELLEELRQQGVLLAAAAEATDLDATVPSCPGWTVRDLVRHVGMVHRWATEVVTAGGPAVGDVGFEAATVYPADDELISWLRQGHEALVRTLRDRPADHECWTFMRGSPTPLHFWTRRQLHETSVHRMDAELAAGRPISPVSAVIAADGIDELLTAFIVRQSGRLRSDEPWTMAVQPSDVDRAWTVRVTAEAPVTVREALPADVAVTGPAGDLYRFLWNRARDGVSVSGADGRMAVWQERVRISW